MKKPYKIAVAMLLIGQIFFIIPFQIVLATSQTGFDYIKEGDRYEYKSNMEYRTTFKNARSGELINSRMSDQYENEIFIEKVDKEVGYVTAQIASYYNVYKHNYTDTISSPSLHYEDADGDGFVEYLSIYPSSYTFLLCTWENYSNKFDTLKKELVNATRDLPNFKYSFTIHPQNVEIKVEYKLEDYFWDPWDPWEPRTEGSVAYNVEFETIVSYNNFILMEAVSKERRTVHSILNASYLQDNDITYTQEQNIEQSIKFQGFFEKFGLWLILGIGIAAAAISIVVLWKKREGLKFPIKKRDKLGFRTKRRNRWFEKGTEFAVSGEFEKAIQCYVAFLKSNPQDYEVWYYKGAAYECIGNYREALECYQKSLEINPEYSEAINSKKEVKSLIEQSEEVNKATEESVKLESFECNTIPVPEKDLLTCPYCKNEITNDIGICMNCGRHIAEPKQESLLETEDSANFKEEKKTIEEKANVSEIGEKIEEHLNELYKLGIDYAFEENYTKAIECFDRILELDPKSYGAWYNKGLMFESLEIHEEAIKCYNEAIIHNPDFAVAKEAKETLLKKMK